MPTAARLVAALTLGVLAIIVSFLIMPLMPEGTDFGNFPWVNMAIGALCGWLLMGPRVGRGFVGAVNNGLTGVTVMLAAGLLFQGAAKMFKQANRQAYDDPFEALADIFVLALEYFFVIAVPSVLITLAIGGLISGLMTENAGRRWR